MMVPRDARRLEKTWDREIKWQMLRCRRQTQKGRAARWGAAFIRTFVPTCHLGHIDHEFKLPCGGLHRFEHWEAIQGLRWLFSTGESVSLVEHLCGYDINGRGRSTRCLPWNTCRFRRRSANPMRHPLEDNLARDRVNSQCEHKHRVHRQVLLVQSVEIVNHVKIAIF